ncbi:hypothetical protein ES332_D02G123200v1 [Gossypium tomentosum]|uniref:BZIP domain-containing protein n=1 Tax=Gossypium tomentosum TaxID=34277 RepID=A0A5D2LW68_GOSTO|nr:hypothetical protein ES332_D02G123200v1 [Gossypium tomentosum]
MSPVVSEILRSGFIINSSLRRRTHLVQSFSVVFLYCGNSNSNSSGSTQHQLMDQRKRKRMESNRESARRSRMRKQKHIDDLVGQITELKKDNNQILTSINFTTHRYLNIEAENSVLRAQMTELSQRLDSLNDILHYLNREGIEYTPDCFTNPFNVPYLNQQPPIMASAHIFQY